jgi:hypothetical protein
VLRRFAIGTTCCLVCFVASTALASQEPRNLDRSCGVVPHTHRLVKDVRTRNVACRLGRRVARHFFSGLDRPLGFRCRDTLLASNATWVRCSRANGRQVVRFIVYVQQPVGAAPSGVLTGRIYLVGGPAGPSGGSACQGTRCPTGGRVIVRDNHGNVAVEANVRPGQPFHFRLSPGRYKLSAEPGCGTPHVRITAGKRTKSSIICDIP